MTHWAFLVGISNYENKNDFITLEFCDLHAKEFANVLKESGDYEDRSIILFTTTNQTNKKPTRNRLISEFSKSLKKIQPKDTLLIYFVGHGGTYKGKNYLFPMDAFIDHKNPDILMETSITIEWFITQLESYESQTWNVFLIIDACRQRMSKSMSLSLLDEQFGIHEYEAQIIDKYPAGIAFLFSCSPSQRAYSFDYEGKTLSIFSYILLEGLRGKIPHPITYGKLVNFTKNLVPLITKENNRPVQIPHDKSSINAYDKELIGFGEKKIPPFERISHIMQHRPPKGKFREQLFWLVDVIYSCKATGIPNLIEQANLMEDVWISLGEYLENGNQQALDSATVKVEQFARIVKANVLFYNLEKKWKPTFQAIKKQLNLLNTQKISGKLSEYEKLVNLLTQASEFINQIQEEYNL